MEMKGIITARTCPRCGHHEIGVTSRDGVFHPLKPGTVVQVMEASGEGEFGEGLNIVPGVLNAAHSSVGPESVRPPTDTETLIEIPQRPQEVEEEVFQYEIWVPEALAGDRRFRLKYGVMVKPGTNSDEMTPDDYRMAYMLKLQILIEKEVYVPVAVILDRFFTSPHLASGTSKEIAEAMWDELDEIKAPVLRVTAWLDKQTDDTLAGLIQPVPREELENAPVDEAAAIVEFDALSLEDFLEML